MATCSYCGEWPAWGGFPECKACHFGVTQHYQRTQDQIDRIWDAPKPWWPAIPLLVWAVCMCGLVGWIAYTLTHPGHL